jgi:hypothetical protein
VLSRVDWKGAPSASQGLGISPFGEIMAHEKTRRSRRVINHQYRARPKDLPLLVCNVQAAASAALAVHHFATVGGLHAGAEADGSDALDSAGTVWVVHKKKLSGPPDCSGGVGMIARLWLVARAEAGQYARQINFFGTCLVYLPLANSRRAVHYASQ